MPRHWIDVRSRISIAEATIKDNETKLAAAKRTDKDHLTTERDQLNAALEKWTTAVAARDDALKQTGDQVQKLTADRNDAVQKYNDLANKYNAAGEQRESGQINGYQLF